MKTEISLKQMEVVPLTPKAEPDEGKRWSFSFVYYLEDLRNIYRLYDDNHINGIPELLGYCKKFDVKSKSGKQWTQRSLLENVNALKNFELLSLSNTVIEKGLFHAHSFDEALTPEEQSVFKNIFFKFFRFQEFHRLFLREGDGVSMNNILESSHPILLYMQNSRFTNHFMTEVDGGYKIQEIAVSHADMMRFWDVYVKWGTSLGLLKKYPLKAFGIGSIPPVKGFSIAYFWREMPMSFSVFGYMKAEMQGSYLYIPDVIYAIIKSCRYAVDDILERITEECTTRSDEYRAQSTSAIFVNDKEDFLFPKVGNTYITHLLKL